jgi:hemolysin activation/secretion protein
VVRSRELSLWVSGTFDVAQYDKEAAGTSIFDDQLRVGRLGANLYGTDRFDGTNRLSIELSHGFDALGASSADGPRSRFGASAEFTKLRVDVSRDQALGGNFWLEGQLAGQASADELLSSEEFSLGGTYIGRGYDFSELTGDHGLGGSLELRYGRDLDGSVLRGFQAYGFYDAGVVWNLGEFETDRETLASAGLGVRLVFEQQVRLNLEYTRALTRAVDEEGEKAQRLFFKLSQGF